MTTPSGRTARWGIGRQHPKAPSQWTKGRRCTNNQTGSPNSHTPLPFILVFDKGERTDGTLSGYDFSWDEENDRYICPGNKEMRHTWRS